MLAIAGCSLSFAVFAGFAREDNWFQVSSTIFGFAVFLLWALSFFKEPIDTSEMAIADPFIDSGREILPVAVAESLLSAKNRGTLPIPAKAGSTNGNELPERR